MGEHEDNQVPNGGFWSYRYWAAFIPMGILFGLMAYFKNGGKWPF